MTSCKESIPPSDGAALTLIPLLAKVSLSTKTQVFVAVCGVVRWTYCTNAWDLCQTLRGHDHVTQVRLSGWQLLASAEFLIVRLP